MPDQYRRALPTAADANPAWALGPLGDVLDFLGASLVNLWPVDKKRIREIRNLLENSPVPILPSATMPATAQEWEVFRKANRSSEIHDAVEFDNVDDARRLLDAGEDPNARLGISPTHHFSLLHHALDVQVDGHAQDGPYPTTEMIELLIGRGANVEERSYRGGSSLDMAQGYVNLRSVILEAIEHRSTDAG